jgi:predicted transcriptional regulator
MSSYIRTGWETGFFQSPNCIFDVDNLSINEKMCYLYLCRLADGEMKSFPSYATMAKKMSVSRPTAIKSVKSLEEKGYLQVERRKISQDKNMTNVYTMVHPDEVIHNSKGDLPPNECVVKEVYQGSKGDLLGGKGDLPNKYSIKNTQLKKDIYTDSGHAEKKEFHFYNWLDNK